MLLRVTSAGKVADAKQIVRICADNPLVGPDEIDRLVNFYSVGNCDYAWNDQPREGGNYPDGFGAEILSMRLLSDLSELSTTIEHREHVTAYLWDNRDTFRLCPVLVPKPLAYPSLSFEIDEPSDLTKLDNLLRSASLDPSEPAVNFVQVALSQIP